MVKGGGEGVERDVGSGGMRMVEFWRCFVRS